MTFEQMIAGTRTDHRPFPELRAGNLGVRIAATAAEIDAVQALRYRVFYQEMGAKADAATAASLRDRDAFDAVADHLLVVDHAIGDGAGRRGRHLSADPARGRGAAGPLLLGRRIRHHADHELPGPHSRTRPLLRRCRLSQPGRHATAVARHRRLCVPLPDRSDVRLRQPARHRSGRAGRGPDLSLPQPPGAAGGAPARAARPLCRDAADGARARSIRSGCRRNCRR